MISLDESLTFLIIDNFQMFKDELQEFEVEKSSGKKKKGLKEPKLIDSKDPDLISKFIAHLICNNPAI